MKKETVGQEIRLVQTMADSFQPRAYTRKIVSAEVLTMVSGSCPSFSLGALLNQTNEGIFLTPIELGYAVGTYRFRSALSSPFGRRTVAQINETNALRSTGLGNTVGLTHFATVESAVSIIVVMAFLGLQNALIQPVKHSLLSQSVTNKKRGISFGIAQSAIPMLTLMCGVLLALFNTTSGWTVVLAAVILALVGQLVIPGWPQFKRREPTALAGGLVSAIFAGTEKVLRKSGGTPMFSSLFVAPFSDCTAATVLTLMGVFLVGLGPHLLSA